MSETRLTLRDAVDDLVTYADTLAGLEEGTAEHTAALEEFTAGLTRGREKVDRFAHFLRRIIAEQKYLLEESKRLKERAWALERLEERLRGIAAGALVNAGIRSIQGAGSTLSLRQQPDACEVYDEAAVPAEYVVEKVVRIVDKRLALGAMHAGVEIPGCRIRMGGEGLSVR